MQEYRDLQNKVVLISGASGLIGKNLIIEFLNYGSEVYGIDIDKKKLILNLKN